MCTITINNKATFNATGIHTKGNNKPVINLDTGAKYASATDAAETLGCSVHNVSACCRGRVRTCKGYHLAYVKHASENVDILADRISAMHIQSTTLERKANAYDELKSQLAEQNQLKDELTKANEELTAFRAYKEQKAKVTELKRIRGEMYDAWMQACADYTEAEATLFEMEEAL